MSVKQVIKVTQRQERGPIKEVYRGLWQGAPEPVGKVLREIEARYGEAMVYTVLRTRPTPELLTRQGYTVVVEDV